MKDFEHYILTKFNVGWKSNGRVDKNGNEVNSDEWLDHRKMLFDKYCYPSVINQINQNFKWLIAFDKDTPSGLLYTYNRPNVFPLIYEGRDTFRNHMKSGADFIITSRLDNDDMYDERFVDIIHGHFNGEEIIIDVSGLQYSINYDKYYKPTNPKPSPFISLVEKNKPYLDTVLKDTHGNMDQYYPYMRLGNVLYTQIIHDRNLLNKETGVIWKK